MYILINSYFVYNVNDVLVMALTTSMDISVSDSAVPELVSELTDICEDIKQGKYHLEIVSKVPAPNGEVTLAITLRTTAQVDAAENSSLK